MAVYEISASTIIAAEPEHVWAVLDDFENWPRWMPSMKNLKVELLTPGSPAPGFRFRLRGVIAYADLEVTEYTPLERATSFRLNFPPFTGANRCLLIPLGYGRYQIDRTDYVNLPEALVQFLDTTQRERFSRLADDFLSALKRAVEQKVGYDVF